MKNTELKVITTKGELRAVAKPCSEYPGIDLYLGDTLYASLEVYEDDELLRLRGYDDISDEPMILETLKEF